MMLDQFLQNGVGNVLHDRDQLTPCRRHRGFAVTAARSSLLHINFALAACATIEFMPAPIHWPFGTNTFPKIVRSDPTLVPNRKERVVPSNLSRAVRIVVRVKIATTAPIKSRHSDCLSYMAIF